MSSGQVVQEALRCGVRARCRRGHTAVIGLRRVRTLEEASDTPRRHPNRSYFEPTPHLQPLHTCGRAPAMGESAGLIGASFTKRLDALPFAGGEGVRVRCGVLPVPAIETHEPRARVLRPRRAKINYLTRCTRAGLGDFVRNSGRIRSLVLGGPSRVSSIPEV